MFLGLVPLLWCEINPCGVLGRIRGEMVSGMTTHLPSTLVAHAGGKLCEHLAAAQAPYPASISSCGLRPKSTFDPARTFTPCRESWTSATEAILVVTSCTAANRR